MLPFSVLKDSSGPPCPRARPSNGPNGTRTSPSCRPRRLSAAARPLRIGVNPAVELLEFKVRVEPFPEVDVHRAVERFELRGLSRIPAEGDFHLAVERTDQPRTRYVFHFDAAVQPVDIVIAGGLTHVYGVVEGVQRKFRVERNLHVEIEDDAVPVAVCHRVNACRGRCGTARRHSATARSCPAATYRA